MKIEIPFRRPGARSRITPIAALIVLTWAAVYLPRLLQTLTAPKFRLEVGDAVAYSPIAGAAEQLLQVGLLGTCVLVVLGRVRRLPTRLSWRLFALLAPWVYLVSRDLLLEIRPQPIAAVYPAVVIAVWILQPRLEDLRPIGFLGVTLAGVSVLLGALLPQAGILNNVAGEAVNPNKKILPWGILVGPLTSGNNLGQGLAVTVPAVLLLPRRTRPAATALIMFALVWTASRSSITAAVVAGVAVFLVRRAMPDVRAGLAGLTVVVPLAAVLLVPYFTDNDLAFTNRGYIWRRSLEAWQQSPLFGLGSDYYSRIGGSSDQIVETAFHGHNVAVHLLVTGGWVLLGLFLFLVANAVVVAARWAARGEYYPVAFLVAVIVSCSFEVSVGFVDRQFMLPSVMLPLAVLLLAPASAKGRVRRPAAIGPAEPLPAGALRTVATGRGRGGDAAWPPVPVSAIPGDVSSDSARGVRDA